MREVAGGVAPRDGPAGAEADESPRPAAQDPAGPAGSTPPRMKARPRPAAIADR